MKIYSLQLSRLIIALLALCLPLCGCGGGSSSGTSGPTPKDTALFAPFIGTYNAVSVYNPGNASARFDLTLAIGKGNFYGSSVPVVTAKTAEPQNVFNGQDTGEWNYGKAYLKDATLSADGTRITALNFIIVKPGESTQTDLSMTIAPSSISGTFTDTVTVGPGGVTGVIASSPYTLTRQ